MKRTEADELLALPAELQFVVLEDVEEIRIKRTLIASGAAIGPVVPLPAEDCRIMRRVAAVTLALALTLAAVPAAAQQRTGKPTPNTARETDRSPVGTRSVIGTVKETTDKGIVVFGRETGNKDQEWAFVVDATTRIAAGSQVRGASDLRQGDAVTVTYTNRDGKIVGQSVSVNTR